MESFGWVEVVDAMYVFDVENLEDVVYSGYQLDIWAIPLEGLRGVGEESVLVVMAREIVEMRVAGIGRVEWIVLVGQMTEVHVAA